MKTFKEFLEANHPDFEEKGDGIYTCQECGSKLDDEDECSNPECRLHPKNGGYGAHYTALNQHK